MVANASYQIEQRIHIPSLPWDGDRSQRGPLILVVSISTTTKTSTSTSQGRRLGPWYLNPLFCSFLLL